MVPLITKKGSEVKTLETNSVLPLRRSSGFDDSFFNFCFYTVRKPSISGFGSVFGAFWIWSAFLGVSSANPSLSLCCFLSSIFSFSFAFFSSSTAWAKPPSFKKSYMSPISSSSSISESVWLSNCFFLEASFPVSPPFDYYPCIFSSYNLKSP